MIKLPDLADYTSDSTRKLPYPRRKVAVLRNDEIRRSLASAFTLSSNTRSIRQNIGLSRLCPSQLFTSSPYTA